MQEGLADPAIAASNQESPTVIASPPITICPPGYAIGAVPSYVVKPRKRGRGAD